MNFEEGLTKIQMRAESLGHNQEVNLFICCNEKKDTWLFTVGYIYIYVIKIGSTYKDQLFYVPP